MKLKENAAVNTRKTQSIALAILGVLVFVFSVDLITYSTGILNSEVANNFFTATNNPFVGLFIGILITALIQSSSTISAMIVAMVTSASLGLEQAVPLIMGANIGTTLTSNLVSLSFIAQKKRFKKALSAGILHDIFNICTTVILFPLEVYFGLLSGLARFLARPLIVGNDATEPALYNPPKFLLRPVTEWISSLVDSPLLWLSVGVGLLVVSISLLSKLAYASILSPNYKKGSKNLFKRPYQAFAYGVVSTAAVQSSTITTSLIVTIVATGKASLNKVFPFIIGANIGTTITAGIAALYKTEAGISIALVHFLFNVIGAAIFLPFPIIRGLPSQLASWFGTQVAMSRIIGLAYILLTFFIIPFLLIYFSQS